MHNLPIPHPPIPQPTKRPPIQLAIESIGKSCSLAILRDMEVLRAEEVDGPGRAAAELAPHLDDMVRWAEQHTDGIGLVSVANGPGSFTGLRVGVTSAKAYAYATKTPLVAVPSLAAIAAARLAAPSPPESATPAAASRSSERAGGTVLVGVNAYREQVFAGEFDVRSLETTLPNALGISQITHSVNPASVDTKGEPWWEAAQVIPTSQWYHILDSRLAADPAEEVLLAGDAVLVPESWRGRYQKDSVPLAVGVGRVAARIAESGSYQDPLMLTPNYLRSSAAEEKSRSRS